jgi:hypothetical protein
VREELSGYRIHFSHANDQNDRFQEGRPRPF